MKRIEAALRGMIAGPVGIGVTNPADAPTDLWPQEAAAMSRAIPKRRAEFAAGRRAARFAMTNLNLDAVAVPQSADRAPIWPAALTGSIAHCDACCVAVVARTDDFETLGVDIEPATPLDADLIPVVCTLPERDWLSYQTNPGLAAKMIFSAKEAVYKAQYPLTGQVIGFDAVTVEMTDDHFTTMAHPMLPKLKGTILIQEGLILSIAHV